MLVLTRRVGESLRIGGDIVVTVTDFNKEGIELCVNGSEEVSISKKESVSIREGIQIKVVKIITGQVKLGVDAPEDVIIKREELYMKDQATDLRR